MSNLQTFTLRLLLSENKEAGVAKLVEILRSSEGPSVETLTMVADMLDLKGNGDWKLTIEKRGKGPVRRIRKSATMDAAGRFLEDAIDERGELFDNAVADAVKEFAISRTSAITALRQRREAKRIMDEIEEETGERPDAVFTS